MVLKSVCMLRVQALHGIPECLHLQTKGREFDSHRGQADFSACPVWIYTQSNNTNTQKQIEDKFVTMC